MLALDLDSFRAPPAEEDDVHAARCVFRMGSPPTCAAASTQLLQTAILTVYPGLSPFAR